MKTKERYFVVNRYPGKNGTRNIITELGDHEEACLFAFFCVSIVIELTGVCDEEFVVFVGSKTKLEKLYH